MKCQYGVGPLIKRNNTKKGKEKRNNTKKRKEKRKKLKITFLSHNYSIRIMLHPTNLSAMSDVDVGL